MRTSRRSVVPVFAAVVILSFALGVLAAPFLPRAGDVSGEIRSLAGLQHVNLSFARLPGQLSQAGVAITELRDQTRRLLGHAGVAVVEDREVPTLELQVLLIEGGVFPEAIVFCYRLRLLQETRVLRIKEDLTVPTYEHVVFGLTDRAKIAIQAREGARLIVEEFLDDLRRVGVEP